MDGHSLIPPDALASHAGVDVLVDGIGPPPRAK